MPTTRYYRRFRQDGAAFYISESGSEVDEATAKKNLMTERNITETVLEDTFESARSESREGSPAAKLKMEEAFARFTPGGTGRRFAARATGRVINLGEVRTREAGDATAKMEEAFERVARRQSFHELEL